MAEAEGGGSDWGRAAREEKGLEATWGVDVGMGHFELEWGYGIEWSSSNARKNGVGVGLVCRMEWECGWVWNGMEYVGLG